jgi:hypothetical protein
MFPDKFSQFTVISSVGGTPDIQIRHPDISFRLAWHDGHSRLGTGESTPTHAGYYLFEFKCE